VALAAYAWRRAEAEDYALDLRDFHAGSGAHPVVPVLVSDNVPAALPAGVPDQWRDVLPPMRCGADGLPALISWVQTQRLAAGGIPIRRARAWKRGSTRSGTKAGSVARNTTM